MGHIATTSEVCTLAGNAQQKFKARMQWHFGEVKLLIMLGKKSDSHVEHFRNANGSADAQHEGITCNII